jgi:hypothetical protein
MRIGKFSNLTELAKGVPHDQNFVNQFRTAGSQILSGAVDTLFRDQSSSREAKEEVVEDLRDVRGAMMACLDRVDNTRTLNVQGIKTITDLAFENKKSKHEEPGDSVGTKHIHHEESISVKGPRNQLGGTRWGSLVWSEGKVDQMVGPKNFLAKLHKVIALATAVAALAPGPIATSVGTFAREEATSELRGSASGSVQSRGGGLTLLGAWGNSSAGSSQADIEGSSRYQKVSTDERIIGTLDDLSLMMDQAKSVPPNEARVIAYHNVETVKHIDGPLWFDKEEVTTRTENREVAVHEYEPARLWMPESGLSEYQ